MTNLKDTKTHENLKAAFAGESMANRRYLYFATKADVEGQNDISALFRSTAEGETGHAHGHLDYLAQVGDPATELHVSGHGEGRARRAFRRNCRLVRDAGEGGAVAREPLSEGAGRSRGLTEIWARVRPRFGAGRGKAQVH